MFESYRRCFNLSDEIWVFFQKRVFIFCLFYNTVVVERERKRVL